MLIEFEDRLDDGRAITFEADEFEAPDPSVGYGGAVICPVVRLDGTGFPVSLTDAEEERLTGKALELWLDATSHDYDDWGEWQ